MHSPVSHRSCSGHERFELSVLGPLGEPGFNISYGNSVNFDSTICNVRPTSSNKPVNKDSGVAYEGVHKADESSRRIGVFSREDGKSETNEELAKCKIIA